MNAWKVIWFADGTLRETLIPPVDIFNVVYAAQSAGCWNVNGIIRIERMSA